MRRRLLHRSRENNPRATSRLRRHQHVDRADQIVLKHRVDEFDVSAADNTTREVEDDFRLGGIENAVYVVPINDVGEEPVHLVFSAPRATGSPVHLGSQ
jgi:hypothetical protein